MANTADSVTVSVAARELGVSVDTIRRWSKLGLIKAARDQNNRRLFSKSEIERLLQKKNGVGNGVGYRVLGPDPLIEKATCIDLFAGGGGTALGLHNAGLNHVLLNEFDKDAVETLRRNSESHGLGSLARHSAMRARAAASRTRAARCSSSSPVPSRRSGRRSPSARTCAAWSATTGAARSRP